MSKSRGPLLRAAFLLAAAIPFHLVGHQTGSAKPALLAILDSKIGLKWAHLVLRCCLSRRCSFP
jgi:hypothetical protein